MRLSDNRDGVSLAKNIADWKFDKFDKEIERIAAGRLRYREVVVSTNKSHLFMDSIYLKLMQTISFIL